MWVVAYTFRHTGVRNNPDLKGVIPRSFEHVFTHIARTQDQQYLVRASYLEIYQEEIRDLLAKDQTKRLELKERPDTGGLHFQMMLRCMSLLHQGLAYLDTGNMFFQYRYMINNSIWPKVSVTAIDMNQVEICYILMFVKRLTVSTLLVEVGKLW